MYYLDLVAKKSISLYCLPEKFESYEDSLHYRDRQMQRQRLKLDEEQMLLVQQILLVLFVV